MIQNTANKQLSELFSADNNISYYIPKYQREYIWNKLNWEAFFDDITESDGGHFLGSIICINTQLDSSKPANLELVDGQQRMTTISLLYLAIYQYLKANLIEKDNLNAQLELLGLQKRITINDQNNTRLTPSYTNGNVDDYKYIFSNIIPEIKSYKKPKYHGNKLITKAFNYFIARLSSVDEAEQPIFNYDSVKILLNKFNSATLVKIDVATHADAFTLFETLNNRGVPLSAIDLIKNKLLGQLEKTDISANIDTNFERWNMIIKNLSDDYNIQERFLRQFYNAFKSEKYFEIKGIQKALRSNLIRIYEELINRDVEGVFNQLELASNIYSKNIQYESEIESPRLLASLRNLENVNGADGYMLLLFIDKYFNIPSEEKSDLVDLLCRYFIRRNVTDMPPTRDLTNLFIDIIDKIKTHDTYNYNEIRKIILDKGKPSNDDKFREKLNGDLYEENVGATRYILSSIELAQSQTKEKFINFYAREKNNFIWTVEHVLPQGENLPKEWVDMIALGDTEKAQKIKKMYVHKLGNLTLTGYNSKLSNLALNKKQDRKDSSGKYVGYKNGLTINEVLKDTPSWSKEDIETRTHDLVNSAIELFKL